MPDKNEVPRARSTNPKAPRAALAGRLRRDPIFFGLWLLVLGFSTWALAITWRLMGDPVLLGLTLASLVPAFYLFYLREQAGREH